MPDNMQVPVFHLADGTPIPAIGMGTFGSDHYSPEQVANAVFDAFGLGFRHFDCAAVYGNEAQIGEVLTKCRKECRREDLTITSKLWNDKHKAVRESCERTLRDLQLDELDFYLVHWPFPNVHPVGADPDFRDPNARPYIHEAFMETWREMEKLQHDGLIKHIGTSNMTISKLELLLRDADIAPAVNQMELHPTFQQTELFEYCKAHSILPVGYSPIGSPNRPQRDKTEQDAVDIETPVVVEIAKAHGVHPALICLKWAVQRGQLPIPFSVHKEKNAANLHAVCTDPLTADEMEKMKTAEAGSRLIKGQVFLWQGAKDWRVLWD